MILGGRRTGRSGREDERGPSTRYGKGRGLARTGSFPTVWTLGVRPRGPVWIEWSKAEVEEP